MKNKMVLIESLNHILSIRCQPLYSSMFFWMLVGMFASAEGLGENME